MTTNHQDAVLKPLDDWLSIALFRTVQELTLHDFKYSAERDLARAELHGERLDKLC